MRKIQLTKGKEALVDADDFDRLSQHNWYCNNKGYAVRRGKKGEKALVFLHHEVSGVPGDGMQTDHINRNRLDNRKCNLRFATRTQNCANRAKISSNTSSKYKGVHFESSSKRWKSVIEVNGKKKTLGRFLYEIEAAKAYNFAAIKYFGEYASLNLI